MQEIDSEEEELSEVEEEGRSEAEALLIAAIEEGNIDIVKDIMSDYYFRNYESDHCDTLLHLAVSAGHIEICRFLIDEGIGLDDLNANEETALLLATEERNVDIVTLLLERGADANIWNSIRMTPLMVAAGSRDINLATLLLENGATESIDYCMDDGMSPLYRAACFRDRPMCELLIKYGANIDNGTYATGDGDILIPLYGAIIQKSEDICTLLVKAGANIYMLDILGTNALDKMSIGMGATFSDSMRELYEEVQHFNNLLVQGEYEEFFASPFYQYDITKYKAYACYYKSINQEFPSNLVEFERLLTQEIDLDIKYVKNIHLPPEVLFKEAQKFYDIHNELSYIVSNYSASENNHVAGVTSRSMAVVSRVFDNPTLVAIISSYLGPIDAGNEIESYGFEETKDDITPSGVVQDQDHII